MNGEIEYGKCEFCGKDAPLIREYRHYENIKCECHSPCHFDMIRFCKECGNKAAPPTHTKIIIKRRDEREQKLVIPSIILEKFKSTDELLDYLDKNNVEFESV